MVYWSLAYGTVPFLDNSGHIVVQVDLDGTSLDAIVDTGAYASLLDEVTASRFFGFDPDSPDTIHIKNAPADALVHYARRFKKLTIGDVVVSNPTIGILPDKAEKSFNRDAENAVDNASGDLLYGYHLNGESLMIGMDILRQLHIYIAYGERKIYVTPADAHLPGAPTAGGSDTH